jgi:hypothetical protein
VADPEGEEKARKSRVARALKGGDEVCGRLLPHPVETSEGICIERKDVRDAFHHASIYQLIDELLSKTVHVQRGPARHVQDVILELRGAVEVCAASDRFPLESDDRPAAHRALGRQVEGACASRPLFLYDENDLRDHIARPLHEDGVAHTHILALEFILVVE